MSSPGRVAAEYVHRQPSSVFSDGHGGTQALRLLRVSHAVAAGSARTSSLRGVSQKSVLTSADTALNTSTH